MNRFFVESIEENIAYITGDDFFHGKNVLRLKNNENIYIVSGEKEYSAKIVDISSDAIICSILEISDNKREAYVNITLYQCLPKLDKMDYIVQKNTEIGVKKIVPVNSNRTIVKLDKNKEDKKLERWSKIAKESAKQSMRNIIPEICSVKSFKEMINEITCIADNMIIVPYESEIKNSISKVELIHKNISLIIGPEGGFEETEIQELKNLGAVVVSLGPRILRTETAALVANAVIMCLSGNI